MKSSIPRSPGNRAPLGREPAGRDARQVRVLACRRGRITEPVYRPEGLRHYEGDRLEKAFDLIADRLRSLGFARSGGLHDSAAGS